MRYRPGSVGSVRTKSLAALAAPVRGHRAGARAGPKGLGPRSGPMAAYRCRRATAPSAWRARARVCPPCAFPSGAASRHGAADGAPRRQWATRAIARPAGGTSGPPPDRAHRTSRCPFPRGHTGHQNAAGGAGGPTRRWPRPPSPAGRRPGLASACAGLVCPPGQSGNAGWPRRAAPTGRVRSGTAPALAHAGPPRARGHGHAGAGRA